MKVFDTLPTDSINARVHETFVPAAPVPAVPASAEEWAKQSDAYLAALQRKVFGGWPAGADVTPLDLRKVVSFERGGIALQTFEFSSQPDVRLRLYVARQAGQTEVAALVRLDVLDDAGWAAFASGPGRAFEAQGMGQGVKEAAEEAAGLETIRSALAQHPGGVAYVAPRGVGLTAFGRDPRKATHVRRRFLLLGQTLESMQVWDVRRAVQGVVGMAPSPVRLRAEGQMAGVALYASLFEGGVAGLDLFRLPTTHMEGPHFPNVLRVLDTPVAVAMAARRSVVRVVGSRTKPWGFASETVEKFNPGSDRLTFAESND